jgi:hypothetical protein
MRVLNLSMQRAGYGGPRPTGKIPCEAVMSRVIPHLHHVARRSPLPNAEFPHQATELRAGFSGCPTFAMRLAFRITEGQIHLRAADYIR